MFDACTSDADCAGGANDTQACIQHRGGGICANRPHQFLNCADLTMVEAERPRIGSEMMVTVCVQDRAFCNDQGQCLVPCTEDAHCFDEYPHCEVATGTCKCREGSCRTNGTLCADDGTCRCQNDAECTADYVDTCYDGFCGCSAGSVCPDMPGAHPNTTWVCEPFRWPEQ